MLVLSYFQTFCGSTCSTFKVYFLRWCTEDNPKFASRIVIITSRLTSQRHSALISSDREMFQLWVTAVHYLKISEQRYFRADFFETEVLSDEFRMAVSGYFFVFSSKFLDTPKFRRT